MNTGCSLPHLGFTLHSSVLLEFTTYWAESVQAMLELEEGAIANPTEGRQVGHYWLRNPDLASAEQSTEITTSWSMLEDLANVVATSDYTDLLMVGIGGSALGPQLLVDALPTQGLKVSFIDNTDPAGIDRVLESLNLSRTVVVVLSKSGGTKETRNAMLEVQHEYRLQNVDFASRAIAVTVKGSKLFNMATQESWMGILPLWNWVGGRTSITGMVGLLPLALMKRDWRAFLDGAKLMDDSTRELSLNNPALWLAELWFSEGNGRGDRNMVVLPYKDALGLFGRYLQQLIMESIGKKEDLDGNVVHQGLTVYGNKGSTDQHAFVQQLRDGRHDFFALLLGVLQDREGNSIEVEPNVTSGAYLLGFLMGTREALLDAERSVMSMIVEKVDERTLGALIALFERTVGLYAHKVNINAYDQPGVEAGKKAAQKMLDLKETLEAGDSTKADPFNVWLWNTHKQVNG